MTYSPLGNASSDLAPRSTERSSSKTWLVALAAAMFVGFVLRYVVLARGSMVNEDGIFYIWRAQKLMAGDLWNGVSAYWSPLYSFLIGLIGYPLQDFETGGRIVSLLAGTLLILLTYYLGALVYDRGTGLIASLLVAVHGTLILASTWVMTEALYGLLFVGMITTGWLAFQRNNGRYWALTGLLTGLAYLTKPEALAFLLLFSLLILIAAAADRVNARNLLLRFAIMPCVVAAFVVPYTLFLHEKVGEWTISRKASTNTLGGIDEAHQLKLSSDGSQTIMDQIWGDEYLARTESDSRAPGDADASPTFLTKLGWAYALFRRQVDDFLPSLLPIAFVPLMIIGLFSRPWAKSEATRNVYLGSFIVSTIVGYSFAVTNIRYLFAILPLLLIWTAYGSIVFARWASESITKISSGSIHLPNSVSKTIAIAALLVLLTPSLIDKFDEQSIKEAPLEEQRAGQWLRSQSTDGSATVMASHATVPYYARAHHLFLPDEELGTILDYAKRRQTDFIVFSTRRLKRNKRGFPEVPPDLARDLELVYSDFEGGDKYSVRIYKVRL